MIQMNSQIKRYIGRGLGGCRAQELCPCGVGYITHLAVFTNLEAPWTLYYWDFLWRLHHIGMIDFFFNKFIYLFIFAVLGLRFLRGLSLVAASGGHSSSWCAGLSLSRPLLLRSAGSRCAGSVIVAHGPSCSVACGIFPEQDSNPCPLHWQADSQPLCHQGSPMIDY